MFFAFWSNVGVNKVKCAVTSDVIIFHMHGKLNDKWANLRKSLYNSSCRERSSDIHNHSCDSRDHWCFYCQVRRCTYFPELSPVHCSLELRKIILLSSKTVYILSRTASATLQPRSEEIIHHWCFLLSSKQCTYFPEPLSVHCYLEMSLFCIHTFEIVPVTL